LPLLFLLAAMGFQVRSQYIPETSSNEPLIHQLRSLPLILMLEAKEFQVQPRQYIPTEAPVCRINITPPFTHHIQLPVIFPDLQIHITTKTLRYPIHPKSQPRSLRALIPHNNNLSFNLQPHQRSHNTPTQTYTNRYHETRLQHLLRFLEAHTITRIQSWLKPLSLHWLISRETLTPINNKLSRSSHPHTRLQ
jgi:hypothetical protein